MGLPGFGAGVSRATTLPRRLMSTGFPPTSTPRISSRQLARNRVTEMSICESYMAILGCTRSEVGNVLGLLESPPYYNNPSMSPPTQSNGEPRKDGIGEGRLGGAPPLPTVYRAAVARGAVVAAPGLGFIRCISLFGNEVLRVKNEINDTSSPTPS
jgi:hypothetical protein